MTTALDIIQRATRLLGVYSTGEDVSAEESVDGLAALNSLMDSLANDNQLLYTKTLDSIALTAGVASLTVGPSGGTVTTRPVEVLEETYMEMSGVSYPLALLTLEQYNAIDLKTVTSIPAGLFAQMGMPNITLTLWPVPVQAMTLKLWSNKLITSFATLTTTLALPPGYERALAFMLAEDIAPEYEVEPSPQVKKSASAARRMLKRTNTVIPMLDAPVNMRGPYFRDIRAL